MGKDLREEKEETEQVNQNEQVDQTEENEQTLDEADQSAPENELVKQKELVEDYLSRLQRLQADFENYKRRVKQEKEDIYKFGSENLMLQLLPVMDNFERAMSSNGDDAKNILAGVEMIYRQLKDVLAKEGLTCIEAVGCEFDPNFHEAVMQVESDEHPANSCMEELQKGYILKEKVIRPAMVKVAK